MSRRGKSLPPALVEAGIESLSHEGRGIARIDGKTVFVDGALPGEIVRFRYTGRRSKYDEGYAQEILHAVDQRFDPLCPHFEVCGGCSLQHIHPDFQIGHKQQVLLQQLEHIGGVRPQSILPALTGDVFAYRHKARLSVRYVLKKDRVLVGFREKRKSWVADIDSCAVLHPSIGERLPELKLLISRLSIYKDIPQIEVAVGDEITAMVIRHCAGFTADDKDIMRRFEQDHAVRIFLQGNDSGSIQSLSEHASEDLSYRIDKHDITINFSPLDFTQVNFKINRKMIDLVVSLLGSDPADDVLDLFCGLGNFTLPLARYAHTVTGIEGSAAQVSKALANAERNHIHNVSFYKEDLYQENIRADFLRGSYARVLLDPPRSGAREIIEQMHFHGTSCVVYVSCNPATLARDAGILVKQKGFRLDKAGVIDMFPHTAHVESVATFERD